MYTVGRLAWVAFGTLFLVLNYNTLCQMVRYYLIPGSLTIRTNLLDFGRTRILQTITICFGMVLILVGKQASLLSISATTQTVVVQDLQNTLWHYAKNAFLEESLFRIAPWIILAVLRVKFNRVSWVEILNVLVAIAIAAAFGWAHTLHSSNPNVYMNAFGQGMIGLFYWYLIEEDGLLASTVAHIIYNTIIIVLTYPYFIN